MRGTGVDWTYPFLGLLINVECLLCVSVAAAAVVGMRGSRWKSRRELHFRCAGRRTVFCSAVVGFVVRARCAPTEYNFERDGREVLKDVRSGAVKTEELGWCGCRQVEREASSSGSK